MWQSLPTFRSNVEGEDYRYTIFASFLTVIRNVENKVLDIEQYYSWLNRVKTGGGVRAQCGSGYFSAMLDIANWVFVSLRIFKQYWFWPNRDTVWPRIFQ